MAGSIANAGQFLGQTFLPQTMARMEEMGPAGQMRRQVQGIATNSLMNTGGMAGVAGTGTPATKSYDYTNSAGQSVQIGQDRAAVPLISRETNMGNLRRAAPGAFDAAYLQSQIAQAFPAPVSPVVLSDGAILANPVTGAVVASNTKAPESAFKPGAIREFNEGGDIVTRQWTGEMWAPMTSAPRFQPPQAPQKPFGYDEDQAAKRAAAALAAEKADRERRADDYAFKSTDAGFTNIINRAAQLGTNKNLDKYTGTFDAMTNWSGDAKKFMGDLEELKSNLAMNALNAARAGSANGSTGFGALSEGELAILQNQISKLDPAIGKENFQAEIVDIIRQTKDMQTRLRTARGVDGVWSIQRVQ